MTSLVLGFLLLLILVEDYHFSTLLLQNYGVFTAAAVAAHQSFQVVVYLKS
jgi:hypothetical protein